MRRARFAARGARAILCGPFRTPDILEAHRQGEIKEEAYLYIAKWSRDLANDVARKPRQELNELGNNL